MPDPVEYRDREGRTFSQYVSDQIMAAVIAHGYSVREMARVASVNRTTLQDRLNSERPFNVDEIAQIAAALGMHPAELVNAAGFEIA